MRPEEKSNVNDSALQLRPVSPLFGFEVLGIDLREPLDEQVAERLRAAWDTHALLLFRDQFLSDEQLDRLALVFGEISDEGHYSHYVSNVVPKALVPNGELAFHMDFSYSPNPLRGIMLYAYEAPPAGAGGETLFSSAHLVYELLPPALRARIEGLQVVHSTAVIPPQEQHHLPVTSLHPLAFPHPKTGAIQVFCSPRHFLWIVGMDADEARALCAELTEYFSRPEVVYKHVWRPGDLVVWDNLQLQHARTNFDPKYRRHLRRTQIAERILVPA
jgi:alpha-ketoglutarate-dependent taurine dioxygenase